MESFIQGKVIMYMSLTVWSTTSGKGFKLLKVYSHKKVSNCNYIYNI